MIVIPTLKTHQGRSQLLFLAVLGSLYLPFVFSSGFLVIFVVHSFFTKGFFQNLRQHSLLTISLFMAFFGCCAVSLLYTQNLDVGFFKLQTKLPFLLMPLALAGSGVTLSPKFRQQVMNFFIWATLAAALAALINAGLTSLQEGSFSKIANDDGTLVKQYYFTYAHLAFFIMHPAYFSLYVSSAIFMALSLLVTQKSLIKNKGWQIAILVFLFIFLFLLQGRISILAFMVLLFLGVLIHFFSSGSFKKGLSLVSIPVVFLILVFALAPASLTRRFTEFNSLDYQMDAPSINDFNGFTIRLAEWRCALDAIAEKPLAGHGLGDAEEALFESYRQNNFVVGRTLHYNCHNQFLETPLQSGIIGLSLLLGLFIWLVLVAIRQRDLLLFILVGLFFLSMLTESLLERQWAIGFFCSLILYLGLSSGRSDQEEGR